MLKPKASTLRHKADRLLQELGRKLHDSCEVCGKKMSCLHHFFPKSTSTSLRYDMHNLIPICNGCHVRHHSGDPTIHAAVLSRRGKSWYNKLLKQKATITKTNAAYYQGIIDALTKALGQ